MMKIPLYSVRRWSYALLWCMVFAGNAHAELPTLGDPTIKNYSSKQEFQLGKAFYASLRESIDFIDDHQINHYLTTLGNQLVSHSDAAGKHFKFFIIDADSINAFAGPDGHIGVNSGLLLETRDESQLAGVLAHEISHVSQRHQARAYAEIGNYNIASFATLLAAILISAQDPVAGQAALFAGIAGTQQSVINFTRHNEKEADRIGIRLMTETGINPEGMVGFFEILLSKGDGLNIEYLRTHPLNINRVAEAKSRIDRESEKLPSNSLDFQFCKARFEVITSENPEIYAKTLTDSVIHEYRRALALLRLHETTSAIELLFELTKKNNHPWIRLALADAQNQANQIDAARRTLSTLHKDYPDYLPVNLAYAKTLIAANESQKSITILKRQLRTDDSHDVYEALAEAYFSNGQIDAALEMTGDQYDRQGYTELAIQQYDNALKLNGLSESSRQRLVSKRNHLLTLRKNIASPEN